MRSHELAYVCSGWITILRFSSSVQDSSLEHLPGFSQVGASYFLSGPVKPRRSLSARQYEHGTVLIAASHRLSYE